MPSMKGSARQSRLALTLACDAHGLCIARRLVAEGYRHGTQAPCRYNDQRSARALPSVLLLCLRSAPPIALRRSAHLGTYALLRSPRLRVEEPDLLQQLSKPGVTNDQSVPQIRDSNPFRLKLPAEARRRLLHKG